MGAHRDTRQGALKLGQRCQSLYERFQWVIMISAEECPLAAIKVAVALSSFCNAKTGQCNPSRNSLVEVTALKPATVTKGLRWLKDHGAIEREGSRTKAPQWALIYRCNYATDVASEHSK